VVIGQNADHREIARFVSLHDRNLRPVLSRLNIFRQDISNQLQSMASGQSTIERLDTRGMSKKILHMAEVNSVVGRSHTGPF